MKTAKVTFSECIQDSQDYGSNDEHMVSRVFFTLQVGDQTVEGLYVDVKQAVGASFETGPIEISAPRGTRYRGPFNYKAFRDEAENYYRGLVGSKGRVIRIDGATNIRMRNNRIVVSKTVAFDVTGPDAAW